MKKPDGRLYNITSLRYIKPYISKSLNPNEIGLLPSLSAIKRLFFRLTGKVIYFISFSQTQSSSMYKKRVEKTGGEFKQFHQFNVQNRNFYIPNDMLNREKSILDEKLLLSIIHGDMMNVRSYIKPLKISWIQVYEYDFTKKEDEITLYIEEHREQLNDQAHQNHADIFAEEKRKKRAYMKYHPNRDFEERFKDQLKKNWAEDEDVFVDNGYR